ncbi:helix-turn-helix domain-containing protein [Streptomyces sp. NPDC004561]
MIDNLLLRLRLQSGLTQEELSERSGISVRTIRNFERGLIQRPRRSSVDMLLEVLDPDLKERLRTAPVEELGAASGMAAEWLQLVEPGEVDWQGTRPPRTSLIGREDEIARLGELLTSHQTVVLTGPGGVGKSRVALAAAERFMHRFPDGIAVAEMGRVPRERDLDGQTALEQALHCATAPLTAGPDPRGRHQLLILDNAEHLTRTVPALVDRLLGERPALRILVTARRTPVLPEAALCELPPLPDDAAVALLVDRLRTSCPTLDLTRQLPQVAELVRQLDGLPRFMEFAAHRLRIVPLSVLLADHRAMRLLGSADGSVLPHQRTLEASLRWSLELLDERHQRLLDRLARHHEVWRFSVDELGPTDTGLTDLEVLEVLADLADSSLLQVVRGSRYEYRLLHHVRAVLTTTRTPDAVPVPVPALSA